MEDGVGPDVVVVADDWQVTLTGEVASEPARQRAVEIAHAFPGVTDVRDQLAIGDGVAASPDTRGRPTLRAHPGGMDVVWDQQRPVLELRDSD